MLKYRLTVGKAEQQRLFRAYSLSLRGIQSILTRPSTAGQRIEAARSNL